MRLDRSVPRRASLLRASAVLAVAPLVLAACGDDGGGTTSSGSSGDGPSVLATTSILADITGEVGCGEVEVTSVIPAGTDAHEYEPSTQDADALNQADLVVAVGLGLEEGLQDALDQASTDGVEVVEIGPEVDPLEAGRSEEAGHADEAKDATGEAGRSEEEAAHSEEDGEHGHGAEDPHVWMDPDRMAAAVGVISEQLQQVDGLPVSAEEIQACAEGYAAELEALGAEMDATLAAVPADRRKLVTNHEALGYFADRFDFEVIGAVIPSTSSLGESNPRDLEELATTITEAGVPAIFGETTQPAEVAEALAGQVGGGVEVVELYTETLGEPGSGADTYVTMMRTNAGLVAAGLGGASGTAPGAGG